MSQLELSFFCENLHEPLFLKIEDKHNSKELLKTDYACKYKDKYYFDTLLIVPFHFEKQQRFTFTLHNEKEKVVELTMLLSDIVSCCSQNKSYRLIKNGETEPFGNLFIYTEEVKTLTDYTPVIEVERRRSVIRDLLVKTPKVITQKNFIVTMEVLKIDWDEIWIFKTCESIDIMTYKITTNRISLEMQKLNNNRQEVPLRFVFLRDGKIIHEEETVVTKLKTTSNFENVNIKMEKVKISNPQYEEFANMAESAKKRQYREYASQYSFLDYLTSGVQLDLIIAIDFTISNGFPNRDTSLHYVDPHNKIQNEYVQAIENVGKILEYYDHDGLFPVYGFGGVYKDKPSHCFPLKEEPCRGIDEVIEVYKQAIQTYSLSAPTNFAEIIKKAKEYAKKTINGYYILLIITDGEISDLKKTKSEIIDACDYPLSIVIVGLGNSTFTSMKELDADIHPIQLDDLIADRDIVQFVHFKSGIDLSQETLREIPEQIVSYYAKKGISPKQFKK